MLSSFVPTFDSASRRVPVTGGSKSEVARTYSSVSHLPPLGNCERSAALGTWTPSALCSDVAGVHTDEGGRAFGGLLAAPSVAATERRLNSPARVTQDTGSFELDAAFCSAGSTLQPVGAPDGEPRGGTGEPGV